jgi:hypothetical protein
MIWLLACTAADPEPGLKLDYQGGFWDAPWPSDERSIEGFPTLEVPFVTSALDLALRLDGWGTTSALFMPLEPGVEGTPEVHIDHPVEVLRLRDGGPYGTDDLLVALPIQGVPFEPRRTYEVQVLGDTFAFTTQDPTAEQAALTAAARALDTPRPSAFELTEVFEDYCVFESTLDLPVYQTGEPPFSTEGGTFEWVDGQPVLQGYETGRVVLTLPLGPAPEPGWPTVVFSRTGGGGERPLVDHGPADAEGDIEPGSGVARDFAAVGWAGLSVDGPHGGLRNVTGGDEQFLMFNILNPGAMIDNVRQSALELALLPQVLESVQVDELCSGKLDTDRLVLMGHSMGATIAPLSLAQGGFVGGILSGAGGSWIHNIVYKQSPIEVRPVAEAMLNHPGLTEFDPTLSLVQWAGESADPPVYGAQIQDQGIALLQLQGIVDTYILPPMANATSLSLGLDLVEPALDAEHPDLAQFTPLQDLLYLSPGELVPQRTDASVLQFPEDGLQDGHEVLFQLDEPRQHVRDFLQEL